MNKGSMTPASLYFSHTQAEYLSSGRLWQGIPGLERTSGGILYACWYSGGKTEEPGNVIIMERSTDDGETFSDGFLLVRHDDPEVRCFDPALWCDPHGALRLFWTQSRGFFDGRDGVWMSVCENPDDPKPCFSPPRRIANGLMMNKPTVTRSGEWLFPCAIWNNEYAKPLEEHPELAKEMRSNVYVSVDEGRSFAFRGSADVPDRTFDEHMVVEKEDGSLWMLVRTRRGIGQAFSYDSGVTWENPGFSGHYGPNSRFFIRRLQSGRLLLVNYVNPTYAFESGYSVRTNLMAMLSEDDGKTWIGGLMLDTRRDVSYPDGVQDSEGRIWLIYDRERYKAKEILYACITEEDILAGQLVNSASRLRCLVNRAGGSPR